MKLYKLTVVAPDDDHHHLSATDMNEAGQVVGNRARIDYRDGGNFQGYSGNGFYYDPQSGMTDLGAMVPVSINATGKAVGNHAFSYKAGDLAPTDLTPMFESAGYLHPIINQIDDDGAIACWAWNTQNEMHHALIHGKTGFADLYTSVDDRLYNATARNKHGHVIGYASTHVSVAQYDQPVNTLWTQGAFSYDPRAKALHVLTPTSVTPYDPEKVHPQADFVMSFAAVNDHGEIIATDWQVGSFIYKNGHRTWLPDNGEVALVDWGPQTLQRLPPVGIGNDGLILSAMGKVYDREAPSLGWMDLNAIIVANHGWTVAEGVAIKKNGQILCNGFNQGTLRTRPLILTPIEGSEVPDKVALDLSRLRAVLTILFGIVNDAPGLAVHGPHPHPVGPGPDDPVGPLGRAFSDLSAGQRDALLGLGIGELGAHLGEPASRSEVQRLAARLVAGAAGQLGAGSMWPRGRVAPWSETARRLALRARLASQVAEAKQAAMKRTQ
jgi:hypothetical protein